MDSISTLLENKAKQIDLDNKREEIELVKSELERFMNTNQAKVSTISDKTITVRVRSSVLASELRMMQYKFLKSVSKTLNRQVTRVYIKTG